MVCPEFCSQKLQYSSSYGLFQYTKGNTPFFGERRSALCSTKKISIIRRTLDHEETDSGKHYFFKANVLGRTNVESRSWAFPLP